MSNSMGKRGRKAANGRGGNHDTDGELRSDSESNNQDINNLDDDTVVTLSLKELRSVIRVKVSEKIDSLKSELAQRFDDIDNQFLILNCSISSKLDEVNNKLNESKEELCAKIDTINQNVSKTTKI